MSTLGPSPTASEPGIPAGPAGVVVTAVRSAVAKARADAPVPDRLAPALVGLRAANWRIPRKCFASDEDTSHDVCTFGDPEATRTLLLIGDSHTGVWTEPIARQARARGWKVRPLIKTACPPYDVPIWRTTTKQHFTECDEYRQWALAQVRRIRPDMVAVSGYTRIPLVDPDTGDRMEDDSGGPGDEALRDGMRRTLEQLRGFTDDLVLIGDTNQLPRMSADCLGSRDARLGDCATGRSEIVAGRTADWAEITRRAGGRFVDVGPWLCQDDVCPLVVGNTVVYTDDNHLTQQYAEALGPALADALRL